MSRQILVALTLSLIVGLRLAAVSNAQTTGQNPNTYGSSSTDYQDARLLEGHQRSRDNSVQKLSRALQLERIDDLLLTSTDRIDGLNIAEYIGPISSEYVFSVGEVGGQSRLAYIERNLQLARQTAMQDLRTKAFNLGAAAVIGLDVDYAGMGSRGFAVVVSGTAVKLY